MEAKSRDQDQLDTQKRLDEGNISQTWKTKKIGSIGPQNQRSLPFGFTPHFYNIGNDNSPLTRHGALRSVGA